MDEERAVSPVIGVILMVAVVVLLGSVVFVAASGMADDAMDTNERPVPVSDNLLFNPGFEKGANGVWEDGNDNGGLEPDASIGTAEAYFGSYALKMHGDAEFTGQTVTDTIEPGYTYRLCAQSKIADPDDTRAWVGAQYYDADGDIIAKNTYEVTWTSYREECVLTEIGNDANAESAEVWVYRETSAGDAAIYVDDVSLKQMRYFADPESNENEV
ncbi:type IV pilin [Haloglomus litoreum]|uniref:type IV pilin n=1 Tax=Haloglomus litoreum TaxID=3034026 RepID=UPI0023E846A3|nr:type IV pilin [Haloglomus sp. DT116]